MASPSRRTTMTDFGVDLQAEQSVHDVHPFALQGPRPFDIAFFIEPRLQFHQYCDLLAFLHRFQQRIDDRRIPADAVERHFDREHVRIVRRLANEINHGLERIERMVQQNVLPSNRREHVLVFRVLQRARQRRNKRRHPSDPAGRSHTDP